ncbi:uncharacterized protein K02A2.6-like isoform X1 [Rhagoletis pomonella]|uniref:uncharacterized protein K02A2.6-like isoform X1 n=1 Tax=Rhagoletis pomonella TaxID=28610 RepID=UPI00177F9F3B|nr:uncharacterized protein K02A2.6-like isoform X1 [Rhagoletis pomonella]
MFWKHRSDLFLEDGILYLNNRVIVPPVLRETILSQLHVSHLGIEKTKKRARELVYWPGIDGAIEKMITNCDICQRSRSANVKEPMIPHSIPNLPFNKIGVDICEFASRNYLIIADYYSRYLDIAPLKSKTATECINALRTCFAVHGLPVEIISDNMPFNSYEFKRFCDQIGAKLTTTSPGYSQSNGFAERFVGIAKNLIKKTNESKKELWLALLEYRNTPLKDIDASPVELLMSRKTRTLLPTKTTLFQPRIIPNISNNINAKNYKSKKILRSFCIAKKILCEG